MRPRNGDNMSGGISRSRQTHGGMKKYLEQRVSLEEQQKGGQNGRIQF
jgi:hypothetical protein